jgi:hypothetical protein
VQLGHEAGDFPSQTNPSPISDTVIHAVEAIAKSKGQGSLKITSPGEHVINDSSLIAGVLQYDNDEDDGTNDDIETIHPESEGNDTESYATNEENDDDC